MRQFFYYSFPFFYTFFWLNLKFCLLSSSLLIRSVTLQLNPSMTLIQPQATQAPAVRWSSCEMRVMAKLEEFVREYLRPPLRNKKIQSNSIKLPHLTSAVHRSLSDPLKMGSFQQSKRSDNKRCTVEVRWGIVIEKKYVNIPIQTVIISPWLLKRF